MSYSTCIVASCKTRRKPSTDRKSKNFAIKCFSFPKDPVLKKEWLGLCQVKEFDPAKDCNRKVCIKHFKEDDFIDGLKARLLNTQPRRLKKDAVPSLYLSNESDNEDHTKETEIKKQEMSEKFVDEAKQETKTPKTNDNGGSSIDYLSKLTPIAPKAPIAPQPSMAGKGPKVFRRPTPIRKIFKLSEQPNIMKSKEKPLKSPLLDIGLRHRFPKVPVGSGLHPASSCHIYGVDLLQN